MTTHHQKHFALLLPDLSGGGAERMMLHVAQGLADLGHRIDLVLVRARGEYLHHVPDNVNLVDLSCSRMLAAFKPVTQYIRTHQPDVLLSSLTGTNILALTARKLAKAHTRVVIRQASIASHERRHSPHRIFRLAGRLIPWLYPCADAIVAISHGVKADLADNFKIKPDKVTVIYNPVLSAADLDTQHPTPNDPWFQRGQPPVITGAGRLTPVKGFTTLLQAFAIVRQNRRARLMIFGEGPQRPELQSLANQLDIADDFRLPGFVPDLRDHLVHAAAFVFSSHAEGFGNVLVEAMSTGTPVISTDCPGGPTEILQNGRLGPLVPVGDPSHMAHAIIHALDNPMEPDTLKRRASDFTTDKILPQYTQLILDQCT